MLARLEKLMANDCPLKQAEVSDSLNTVSEKREGKNYGFAGGARYIYESGKLKGSTGVVYNITDSQAGGRICSRKREKKIPVN